MRQQFLDPVVRMRGQACEHVLTVSLETMKIVRSLPALDIDEPSSTEKDALSSSRTEALDV